MTERYTIDKYTADIALTAIIECAKNGRYAHMYADDQAGVRAAISEPEEIVKQGFASFKGAQVEAKT